MTLLTLATFQLHPRAGTGHTIKAAEWQETAVGHQGPCTAPAFPQPCSSTPASKRVGSSLRRDFLWKIPRPHVGQALLEYGKPSDSLLPDGLSWSETVVISITRSSQHLTLPSECVPRDYCKVAERGPQERQQGPASAPQLAARDCKVSMVPSNSGTPRKQQSTR